MNRNTAIRQLHRWTSLVFTVTVIVCFVAVSGVLPFWVFYVPLLPLAVLLFSGLYLFTLPYTARRRRRRTALGT
ncbi:hypothetical protein GCM10010472_36800 [Pseudonocardia halophobica]|uniref:Uncharacterized protein n=1 Tax=Pseudonocardia halophobica TaxID=29401 RepID=A0A9W6UEE9_9PSEU|nr:hypothetical protein [Pseudonocardia halophobica]GLL15905.1 hypothetical protein GCM10017577_70590 [Pseudonocardia halophobica]